jgi:hypothetical protein
LAGSTIKKAVVRRYEREPLAGYINPLTFLQDTGIELLSAAGQVGTVPYTEIKWIAFVREFPGAAEEERRVFLTRPKMEGLWVSLRFRDGEVMEGVMTNNLLQVEQFGFTIIPPDPLSNHQRYFVPRISLETLEVLGVVGSPLKKRKLKPTPKEQIGLFDE